MDYIITAKYPMSQGQMTIQRLYKYGKINKYSEELFSGNKLHFASAKELNDPFECRPHYDFSHTEDRYIEWYVGEALKIRPNMNRRQAQQEAQKVFESGLPKIPETCQRIRSSIETMINTKIGLYCMSAKRDDILMFSHYGNGHRGYCLEFDSTDTTSFFGAAQKVEYCHKYPTVIYYDDSVENHAQNTFLIKYKGWDYEREWRIINLESGSGLKEYPKELLKGVILGASMEKDDKNKIRSWLNVRGGEVQLYQADIQDDEFALTINPID